MLLKLARDRNGLSNFSNGLSKYSRNSIYYHHQNTLLYHHLGIQIKWLQSLKISLRSARSNLIKPWSGLRRD